MAQVYENSEEFRLDAGVDTCIELTAPTQGTLKKLIVKQVTGTTSGFTFSVLNRKDACNSEAEVSDPLDPDELVDRDLHKIQAEVVAGAAISSQFNLTGAYANEDEQDVRRRRTSRIYLDINAVATGNFEVAYAIEPAEIV